MNKFLAALFSIASLIVSAQTMQSLTPELLWKMGRVSDAQVSFDGKYILYNVRYYDVAENRGQSDLFRLSADGKNLLRLTNTPGFNETNARWTPDGNIAYLSDISGEVALYIMNSEDQEIKKRSISLIIFQLLASAISMI
jgi:Tol biopolymer transport system component